MNPKYCLLSLTLLISLVIPSFAQTGVLCVEATISVRSGSTDINCLSAGEDNIIRFKTSRLSTPYGFLVTNTNGDILFVSTSSSINFADLPNEELRVYAFSYIGTILATPGQNIADAELASICYALSPNYITVTNLAPDGGVVATAEGNSSASVCPADGNPDIINFTTTSTGTNYAFLITDEENIIRNVYTDVTVDFEGFPEGVYRVWGLAFTGNLLAAPGQDAAAATLSDACYDLSGNFVQVSVFAPAGGNISLSNGATDFSGCDAPGAAGLTLAFVSQGASATPYVFVLTDEGNNILALLDGNMLDFQSLPAGTSRVWGLAFTGTLLAQPGDNAAAVALSDDCFSLSENFVVVTRTFVDGATVTIEDGSTEAAVCGGDGAGDIFTFRNNSTVAESYTYVITDAANAIKVILSGNAIDLDDAAPGNYRVWGLSYTGQVTAEIGDIASEVLLTDACFDLSENFVSIRVEAVDGGQVAMPNGATVRYACPGDGNPDIVSFTTTGQSSGAYLYVITDANNTILTLSEADSLDFDGVSPGTYRVWGLAYTGNITATPGDPAATTALSDECFDLSDNFIAVVMEQPNGGTVALPDGTTTRYTCPGDGRPDLLMFQRSTGFPGPYAYLITDEDNNILDVTDIPGFDFDGAPAGTCRVWGLAYTGNLTATVGENAAAIALSDDCFDLSDNFITVVRQLPDGGTVAMPNGETVRSICPGDDRPDIVRFDSTTTFPGAYAYLITDENNIILSVPATDFYDFNEAPAGICRVWGLAYTGNLTAVAGADAAATALSDDCFDLSDNFITVIRETPDGGSISTSAGSELTLCVGDGVPDSVEFVVTGASNTNYAYLVTDNDGFLVGTLLDPVFDFDNAIGGDLRVYGVAYTGAVILFPGDNIFEVPVTGDCYDLSDDFIQLHLMKVDGSIILTSDGERETVYFCPNDGIPDSLTLLTGTPATEAGYRFVITSELDVILGFITGNTFNFDNVPLKRTRIWGVSFTGNFLGGLGDVITNTMLSDSCYSLSENFLTIVRDEPAGGQVLTAQGETSLQICIGADSGILDMVTTSGSNAGYAYLITTQNNLIRQVVTDDAIDFNALPPGIYRVWGLSYTGELTAAIGTFADQVPLASSCFELSENFVDVVRSFPVDGGEISTLSGESTVYVCPDDDMPDVLVLLTTSSDTTYRYVITDAQNKLLIPNIVGNVIDFDNAGIGIFRIYGISFNGNYVAQFGDDVTTDPISDNCYTTSDNFITVVSQIPDGGMVSTADGETVVTVVTGDGLPDVLTFANAGASATPYAYVVTDEANVIIGLVNGNSKDFEETGVGVCRVWGLAYTGQLTAQVGDDAAAVELSDDCYNLSDNFVEVIRVEPSFAPEPGAAVASGRPAGAPAFAHGSPEGLSVQLWPNPASDRVQVVTGRSAPDVESAEGVLEIFNAAGQPVYRQRMDFEGRQWEIPVAHLPAGLYVLRLSDGKETASVRFLKR